MSERGSGRTKAILERASRAKKEHGKVLVVMQSQVMVTYALRMSKDLEMGLDYRDFCTATSFNPYAIRGAFYYDQMFVDHSVVTEAHPRDVERIYGEMSRLRSRG